MIRRVLDGETLLLPEKGVEAQKIRALWVAYSAKYDFCRFYSSENAVICIQDDSAILYCNETIIDDYSEIADFFSFSGVNEIFCSEIAGVRLNKIFGCKAQFVNLMRFNGYAEYAETEVNPPLQGVFEIIQSAFGLSNELFEPWYLDMSHRIRHQVSEVRRLEESVLVVQYNLNKEVLFSQIATHPNYQRRGGAKRLVSAVCADYFDSDIYLICEDGLVDFYKSIGFVREGKKCNLIPKM